MISNSKINLTILISVPFFIFLLIIIFLTKGVFTYTLDDPYIHLALAKNIWNGNYGINSIEYSAPSSSILWPFLLAPFSLLGRIFQYIPLLFNYIFLVCTALVLREIFIFQNFGINLFITFVLFFSANIYGLAFTGMEHSLQVLLVGVIALAVLNKHDSGKLLHACSAGKFAIISIVLLPLIRYEGLAISLPVLAYLFIQGERKLALILFCIITLVICAFSLFLYSRGLGILPTSVIAKSSHSGLVSTLDNLILNFQLYWFMLIPVGLLVKSYWPRDKGLALAVLMTTILHFLFGHAGWFGRYEVYYVFFVSLLTMDLYFKTQPFKIYYWIILLFMFRSLFMSTILTPLAATNILYQQGEMAEISRKLNEPVAVNDLGMMSMLSNNYVYDLFGLGSREVIEARKSHNFDADWIASHMKLKKVRYAMIYESWFPPLPSSWIKVGELILLDKAITPDSDRVAFYATDYESQQKFKSILVNYSKNHPSTHFQITIN